MEFILLEEIFKNNYIFAIYNIVIYINSRSSKKM